jgi:hypothetical protein
MKRSSIRDKSSRSPSCSGQKYTDAGLCRYCPGFRFALPGYEHLAGRRRLNRKFLPEAQERPPSNSRNSVVAAASGRFRETHMKRLIVAAVVSLTLVPMGALAQERGGDAALGALSGAVVFGPIGAVAGALVGYTAGPSIARSWGLRGSGRRDSQSRVKTRTAAPRAANPQIVQNGPVPSASPSPPPVQAPAAPAPVLARTAPPVQTLE